jgi:hypothetical protein
MEPAPDEDQRKVESGSGILRKTLSVNFVYLCELEAAVFVLDGEFRMRGSPTLRITAGTTATQLG